jgi:hypothetical protein
MRQKTSTNVTMFNLKEMPVPRLDSGPIFDSIVKRVIQLVSITNDFKALKTQVGLISSVTTESDRHAVQAKIDAQVAKLYGITKEELAHILTQFPLVEDKIKSAVIREFEAI